MICPCHIPPLVKSTGGLLISTPTACHTVPSSRALPDLPFPSSLPAAPASAYWTFPMHQDLHAHFTQSHSHSSKPALTLSTFYSWGTWEGIKGSRACAHRSALPCHSICLRSTVHILCVVQAQSLSFLALLGHPVSWDGLLCPPPRNLGHEC